MERLQLIRATNTLRRSTPEPNEYSELLSLPAVQVRAKVGGEGVPTESAIVLVLAIIWLVCAATCLELAHNAPVIEWPE
jgi:hypothetical protein